jgi:small subunit ribosomal protein S8
MTDPISDMITRIRNAVTAKHTRVDMPASRLKAEIARILQDEGYIQGFRIWSRSPRRSPAGSRVSVIRVS